MMKLNEAIGILIDHAAKNLKGAGTGISSIPTGKERERAIKAIKRAFKYVYKRGPEENDMYNLGL